MVSTPRNTTKTPHGCWTRGAAVYFPCLIAVAIPRHTRAQATKDISDKVQPTAFASAFVQSFNTAKDETPPENFKDATPPTIMASTPLPSRPVQTLSHSPSYIMSQKTRSIVWVPLHGASVTSAVETRYRP